MYGAVSFPREIGQIEPFWVSPRFSCNLAITLRGFGSANLANLPAADH